MAKKKKASKKTAKKTAKKGAVAVAEPEEDKKSRTKLSDLPKKERDTKAHELIDELYQSELEGEDRQNAARKIRSRLRNLDKSWRETYASYTEENYPAEEAEEAEEE